MLWNSSMDVQNTPQSNKPDIFSFATEDTYFLVFEVRIMCWDIFDVLVKKKTITTHFIAQQNTSELNKQLRKKYAALNPLLHARIPKEYFSKTQLACFITNQNFNFA